MDFTEIREVGEATSYARGSQTRQGLNRVPSSTSLYDQDYHQKTPPDAILDYERILKDTPPISPRIVLDENKTILEIVGQGKNEAPDDIIMTIEVSLEEQARNETLDMSENKKPQRLVNFSDRTTECDDESELLETSSNKGFEKVASEIVSKSYLETKSLKSFLSEGMKALPSSRAGSVNIKRGDMKTFRVHFLKKEVSMLIPLSVSLRVFNAIEQCLDAYRTCKAMDQSLLKYPGQPQAYDIKIGEDSEPLEKRKELKCFRPDGELFLVEDSNFDEKSLEGQLCCADEIIPVHVYLADEAKTKVELDMKASSLVKDIYLALTAQKFPGCHPQICNIQIYSDEPEVKPREQKNFFDVQIPLQNLKQHIQDDVLNLELVRKKYADDPTENRKHSDIIKEIAGSPQDNDNENQIILYNEVSANRYEEFEVIKINESGKRQTRILGIDGFKIYNYTKRYKQEQQGGISNMFTAVFCSKFGTMKPEFILLDVNEVELVEPNGFSIETKAEGNQVKKIFYEAMDKKDAKQIVAKLNYLKSLEDKVLS